MDALNPNELLAQYGTNQLVGLFLVLARLTPLFVLAPLFSSKLFPSRAKAICAIALAFGLTPVVGPPTEIPTDPFSLVGLIGKELLVGMAYAYTLGALFAAVSVAGSLLDTLVGFSFGSLVDPITGNQSSVLAQLYSMVGIMVFIAIGGDAWVIKGFARTYELVPMLGTPDLGSITAGAQAAFAGVFTSAVMICAPIMIALIITDIGLGVVSRVVPQLNVFSVGFPANVAVGLTLVGVSLPFVAGFLADELHQSVYQALHALRVA